MKRRALYTIPISILLLTIVITSFFLLDLNPTLSRIFPLKSLSEYTAFIYLLDTIAGLIVIFLFYFTFIMKSKPSRK